MTSVALSSITRRIQKHRRRRIDLYVQRNKVLRERKTADMVLAQRRKREDETFMGKIARANVRLRKLREVQLQLEKGFTNGKPFLMANQAVAVLRAPRKERRERRRELKRRIRKFEKVARQTGLAMMDTCQYVVQPRGVAVRRVQRRHGNMCCYRHRDNEMSSSSVAGSDTCQLPSALVSNIKLELVKKEEGGGE
ncbi:hypothetical protein EMPG_14234 [Blastomyces silverae]|uniref:Uncharacterized protein n=1 Tax=Blastomyces silverae TaxID=2060906 RepID=A0A0H1BH04_9EURO|nr:hypothetical protein EMPG_14234 [Blastomyces silverae]